MNRSPLILLLLLQIKKLMKSIAFSLVCFVTLGLHAQIQRPMASPAAKVEQKVGLTDVKVEYYRPLKITVSFLEMLFLLMKSGEQGQTKMQKLQRTIHSFLEKIRCRKERMPFSPNQVKLHGTSISTQKRATGDCLKNGMNLKWR